MKNQCIKVLHGDTAINFAKADVVDHHGKKCYAHMEGSDFDGNWYVGRGKFDAEGNITDVVRIKQVKEKAS